MKKQKKMARRRYMHWPKHGLWARNVAADGAPAPPSGSQVQTEAGVDVQTETGTDVVTET